MSRHLRIEINGMEWVNGEYDEISFTDGPGGIRVEGKQQAKATGGGLMDLLAGASRSRTEAMAKEKKAALSSSGGGVGSGDSP